LATYDQSMRQRPHLRGKSELDLRRGLPVGAVIVGFFLIPFGIGMGMEAHGLDAAVAISVVVVVLGVVGMIVGSALLRRRWRLQRESR